MYEETKSSIDWKGLFLKLIIIFLIVFIAIKGISMFKSKNVNNDENNQNLTSEVTDSKNTVTFTSNLEKLRNAGQNYFKDEKNKSKIPNKEGYSIIVTLNDLINSGYITTLLDENGNKCEGESSYVTATKEGEKIKLKTNLSCGGLSTPSTVYLTSNSSTTEINNINNNNASNGGSTIVNTGSSTTIVDKNDKKPVESGKNNVPNVNVNNVINQNTNINVNGTTTENIPQKTYYNVNFDSNVGNTAYRTQSVEANKTAYNPGNNSKYGCTFKGWYYDGNKYDFNTPVTKNITLKAYYLCDDSNNNDESETDKIYTYDSVVYTMGWAEKGTDEIEISHVLRLPEDLEDLDIKKVRISNIEIGGPINTTTLSNEYVDMHEQTFFYKSNGWESSKLSKSYLSTIDEDDVSFGYSASRKYKTLRSALDNGFKVTWYADDVAKQCSKTFDVNGVTNLCNYGIYYIVTWEYTLYE